MSRICLLLAFLLPPAIAPAQQICPWLTQGTAAALMGGEVQATVRVANGAGACEFVLSTESGPDPNPRTVLLLEINVGHTPLSECPVGEPLRGIGEDSVFCAADAEGKERLMVRGRVRNTYFLLTIKATGIHAPNKSACRRILEQASEEVAGNLF